MTGEVGHVPSPEPVLDTGTDECICPYADPSTWLSAASCGYGGGYEPGSMQEWNPDCPVHPGADIEAAPFLSVPSGIDIAHYFIEETDHRNNGRNYGRTVYDAWWSINGRDLLAALTRAHDGDDPEVVYAELYANSDQEKP